MGTVMEDPKFNERQAALKMKRSGAMKLRQEFLKTHKESDLKPGAGKGREPDPLCSCHLRNPCPIDLELNK